MNGQSSNVKESRGGIETITFEEEIIGTAQEVYEIVKTRIPNFDTFCGMCQINKRNNPDSGDVVVMVQTLQVRYQWSDTHGAFSGYNYNTHPSNWKCVRSDSDQQIRIPSGAIYQITRSI